ncbi:MAG: hypothetical protein ACIAXF_02820 [Phycisphaerales bacterium JB063]
MFMRMFLPALVGLMMIPTALLAGEGEDTPLVRQIAASPNRDVFETARWNEPIELASAGDAAEYFEADQLAALNAAVDWEQEAVLVFAWRGSGGDRMTAQTDADNPDTVRFLYTRGLTRDLRPHVYVFVLKQGVVWEVEAQRPGRGR